MSDNQASPSEGLSQYILVGAQEPGYLCFVLLCVFFSNIQGEYFFQSHKVILIFGRVLQLEREHEEIFPPRLERVF